MANTIITKNNNTGANVPAVGELVEGELAINVTDKILYSKTATTVFQVFDGVYEAVDTTLVRNTGTPLNNQVAVWTAAATLEGDVDLTFDGANLSVGVGTTIRAWTHAAGLHIADASGSDDPFIGFYNQSAATRQGFVQFANGASGFTCRNEVVSSVVRLEGTDSGSAISRILDGDPDGITSIYYDGLVKLSTATDGIDVTGDVGGTTIGGITSANLVDKTATESITGAWTYEAASGNTNLNVQKAALADQATVTFNNEGGVTRWIFGEAGGTDDDFFLGRYNDAAAWQGSALYVDGITGQVDLRFASDATKLSVVTGGVNITGLMAATTVTGANVTTGADPGHTHTAYAPLASPTFTGTVTLPATNMVDAILDQAVLRDYGVTHQTPTVSANAVTVNLELGNSATIDLDPATADVTLTLSNPPASGTYGEVALTIIMGTPAHGITWPGSVTWQGGSAPVLTLTDNVVDLVSLYTVDAGTTWFGTFSLAAAGSLGTLAGLTDTTITAAASGDILRYNGSAWVDYLETSLAIAGDVTGTLGASVVGNDSHTHNMANLTGTVYAAGSGASLTALTAANISAGNLGSGVLPYCAVSGTASSFKIPFINHTSTFSGPYALLQDSTATFTYNPSTNTFFAINVTGTNIGGITQANLVDKSAAEVVTGAWSVPSLINGKTASYTLILGDAGKTVRFTGATASKVCTIPAFGGVAYPVGTMIGITNDGTVTMTLVITTDTMTWGKDNTTGTRTLAAGADCVIHKVSSTSGSMWKVNGSALVT